MKPYKNIEVHIRDGIARLTFRRPEVLNAMNAAMMDEIIDGLQFIIADASVRVAIISGTGKAFMAGADIKEYAVLGEDEFKRFQQNGLKLYDLIEQAEIPFIAAINGFALGGGFEIALSCDLVVATASAKLGLPEVHLGLIPGGGGTQRLLQKSGLNRVKEILFLGQSYTAVAMYDFGIVNMVCDEGLFDETVTDLAEKLKRRPAQSLRVLKRMLRPSSVEEPFSRRLDIEADEVLHLFQSPLAQELIQTFAEKNKK